MSEFSFKRAIVALVFISMSFYVQAQEFEIRTYGGAAYYLGDLAPYSHNLSSSQGKFTAGFTFGWKFDEVFTLSFKYLSGTLEGNDNFANEVARRRRNLNFTTNINEFGAVLDIYVTTVIPEIKKFGLDFYITTGLNIFKFNPKTNYQGSIVELQPLGTEGQGVPEFGNQSKYKLIQPSFALGVGLDFKLSSRMKFGFEIAPRLTWTDYLDDVSGQYIGTDIQTQLQGDVTSNVANRKGEYVFGISSSEQIPVTTGQQRGDSKDNDWYMMTLSYLSYRFGGPVGALRKANKLKDIKEF